MSDKRPADPNATIQIDLSHIQLEDIALPGAAVKAERGARSEPPPLPPALPTVSPAPAARGKTIAMVVLFVALLVAAVVGGLRVGARVRGVSASESAPPVAS